MPEAEARRPALPEPPLGSPLIFALLAAVGSLLSAACVWLGTGLQDGLGSAWSQILARKLLEQQLWLLPAAMVASAALRAYYARMTRPGVTGANAPGLALLGAPRAFAHFPLYGFIALFGAMAGFAAAFLLWLRARVLPLGGATAPTRSLFDDGLTFPLWFVVYPFTALQLKNEGDLAMPRTLTRRALLKLFVAACAMLMFWTHMVSEETGERVDPLYLTAAGAFWLGDFLLAALRVVPVMRARRGLLG